MAEDAAPVALTPARTAGGASPRRNPLLFSNSGDPEVLVAEASRLRVVVDEKDALLRAVREAQAVLESENGDLRDALLTTRTGHLPKVEVSHIRAELRDVKVRSEGVARERDAAAAENTALRAEVRRLREALIGKETLLTARARSLDRYAGQLQELREEAARLKETLHRERGAREVAEATTLEHTQTVRSGKHAEVELEQAVAEKEASLQTLKATQTTLEAENARLAAALRDLRAMGTEGLGRATLDNFDEARQVAEAAHRDEVQDLRGKLRDALRYEAHARAAVGIAHKLQRRLLMAEEGAGRADVQEEFARSAAALPAAGGVPSRDVVVLLASHAAAFAALRQELKKSRARLRAQFLAELQPIVDEAYQAGHAAGRAKARPRRRSGPLADSAELSAAGTTDATTYGSVSEQRGGRGTPPKQAAAVAPEDLPKEQRMAVFEHVLRTSSATEIASALSRYGLKVVAAPAT
eukprot:TRINITY_DN32367_c0_g1_i1.p1 TRINITY_DN32367_c0_g1~~TRINITY_DN32367_c0_g1_i1.p1  ORF type:complete len:470 (+),score=169.56 TRINITY_DN32367_c0_g1_i1:144-1553(+)